MYYAVIDIGSNTVKCEVFSYIQNDLKSIDFISQQLGIVARIKNSVLKNEDISLLCDTIGQYKIFADKYKAELYCFATESLRRIDNLDDVAKRIYNKCGLKLELISGKDEALYSYLGFRSATPNVDSGIMADMGGGSTEILKFENNTVKELNSFRFGCLSLRRDHVKGRFPAENEKAEIKDHIIKELEGFNWITDTERLCLIGGTGSAIGKLAIELGYTQLPEFPIEVFNALFERLSNTDDETAALLEKYIPARVETILPGMTAYRVIIDKINAKTVYISKGGIRDGFILSKIKEN